MHLVSYFLSCFISAVFFKHLSHPDELASNQILEIGFYLKYLFLYQLKFYVLVRF